MDKKIVFSFLIITFLIIGIGFVFAEDAQEDFDLDEDVFEEEIEIEEEEGLAKGHYKYKYKQDGVEVEKEIQFEYKHNNKWELKVGNYSANCTEGCNITVNQTGNETKFKAHFSNGKNAEIKIMPDTAAERALERLRLVNCIEERGCSIELKDVSKRDEVEVVYELERDRDAKVFGFIKAKMKVKAQVDVEDGEIVRVKKPWWAFLASEPQEEMIK